MTASAGRALNWYEIAKQDHDLYYSFDDIPLGRLDIPVAIHIGAGPSLDKNGHLLFKVNRSRCALIAADSAWGWCVDHGLEPDMVVTVEETRLICDAIREGGQVPLVSSLCARPELKQMWGGPVYQYINWTDYTGVRQRWHGKQFPDLPLIESLPASVIFMQVALAEHIGIERHVFVGVDMYVPEGGPHHCSGFRMDVSGQKAEEVFSRVRNRAHEMLGSDHWSWLKPRITNCTEGGKLEINNRPLEETLRELGVLDG